MIGISDFNCDSGKRDNAAGISIAEMIIKDGLCAYGTSLRKGEYVSCHSHSEGEEWYILLSGEGQIWTADTQGSEVVNRRSDRVKKGSVFCIYPGTAHQLLAITDLEFVFLCPETHLSSDRRFFEDLFDADK